MRTPREPGKGLVKRAREWLRGRGVERRFVRAYAEGRRQATRGPHDVVIVADHLRAFRNIGAILRTSGVFGAREMILVGTRYFDPKPAMGALRHVPLRFFDTFAEAHAALVREGYSIYALEPPRDGPAGDLRETKFPQKTAFVVGHETRGLSFRPEDFAGVQALAIAQDGAVACLNVSAAAAVALYEYVSQHSGRRPGGTRSAVP